MKHTDTSYKKYTANTRFIGRLYTGMEQTVHPMHKTVPTGKEGKGSGSIHASNLIRNGTRKLSHPCTFL